MVACLTVTSCSAPNVDTLTIGQDSAILCVPADPGEPIVVSDQVSLVDNSEAVTILSAELVNAENIEVTDAYLVRSVGRTGMGTMFLSDPDPLWAGRVPAAGATITGDGFWSVSLVVQRRTESAGSADAIAVTYRQPSGGDRQLKGAMRIELRDSCP